MEPPELVYNKHTGAYTVYEGGDARRANTDCDICHGIESYDAHYNLIICESCKYDKPTQTHINWVDLVPDQDRQDAEKWTLVMQYVWECVDESGACDITLDEFVTVFLRRWNNIRYKVNFQNRIGMILDMLQADVERRRRDAAYVNATTNSAKVVNARNRIKALTAQHNAAYNAREAATRTARKYARIWYSEPERRAALEDRYVYGNDSERADQDARDMAAQAAGGKALRNAVYQRMRHDAEYVNANRRYKQAKKLLRQTKAEYNKALRHAKSVAYAQKVKRTEVINEKRYGSRHQTAKHSVHLID